MRPLGLSYSQTVIVAIHVALGATIAVAVANHYTMRRAEVDALRAQADHDSRTTTALEQETAVQEAILSGLREQDPFVVELIARHRHHYQGADGNEILPPPLPAERTGNMVDIQQDQ